MADDFLDADSFLDSGSQGNADSFLDADSFLGPAPKPPRAGALETAGMVGGQIVDAAWYHFPAGVAAALEGDEPFAERDWKDALIDRSRKQSQIGSDQPVRDTALPFMSNQDIKSLGPSLGFSLTAMGTGVGAGLATGAAATPVTSPVGGVVAGYLGGATAAGKTAYNMATNQFVRDLRDTVDYQRAQEGLPPITDKEFDAKATELAPLIKEYGLWEAIPEAVGGAATIGIASMTKKGIGKIFGEKILTRLATKAVGMYGAELATETITQQGQHNVAIDAGMSDKPRRSWTSAEDLGDSFKDVAALTILQTTLMGGGTKLTMMLNEHVKRGGLTRQQYDAFMQLNDEVEQAQFDPEGARRIAVRLLDPTRANKPDALKSLYERDANSQRNLPAGAVEASVLFGQPDEPLGERELSRATTVPLTPEDEASPIDNDLITEGRTNIQDAQGAVNASTILEAAGFPRVDSEITITSNDGTQSIGTVIDAFDFDGIQGAKIRMGDGRVVAMTFDQLRGKVGPLPTIEAPWEATARRQNESMRGARSQSEQSDFLKSLDQKYPDAPTKQAVAPTLGAGLPKPADATVPQASAAEAVNPTQPAQAPVPIQEPDQPGQEPLKTAIPSEFADLFDDQGGRRFPKSQAVKDFGNKHGLGYRGIAAIQSAVMNGESITIEQAREIEAQQNARNQQEREEQQTPEAKAKADKDLLEKMAAEQAERDRYVEDVGQIEPGFYRDVGTGLEFEVTPTGMVFTGTGSARSPYGTLAKGKTDSGGTAFASYVKDGSVKRSGDSNIAQGQAEPQNDPVTDEETDGGSSILGDGQGRPFSSKKLPVADIKQSKDVPNFKAGANESGVVEPLQGSFDDTGVAPIIVWQRNNGDYEVVSGRHRLDLARRSGTKEIAAQVFREADGYNRNWAKQIDAELNIRDENGEVRDYANYFRARGESRESAQAKSLLSRRKGRDGFDIAESATDLLYAAYQAEEISDQAAADISRKAPKNEALQAMAMQQLKAGKGLNTALGMIEAVQAMQATGRIKSEQGDLFGMDDSAMQEAERMAREATRVRNQIKNQIRAAKGAANNPEAARSLGVDVKNPEAVRKKLAELEALAKRWEKWPTDTELRKQLSQETEGSAVAEKTPEKAPKPAEDKPQDQPEATTPTAEATTPAPQATTQPVTIENFTEKSIIVRGLSYEDGSRFEGMKARPLWNTRQKAWVFSRKREAEVREVLADVLAPAPQAKPEASDTPARPKVGDVDYTLTDARNDLIDLRTQAEAQGRVRDARLMDRVRRQEALVKEMEAATEPTLELTTQTEAELAEADAKRKADEAKRKEEDRKQKIRDQSSDFTLTDPGMNPKQAELEAGGQSNLFDQPNAEPKPKPEVSENTVFTESAAEEARKVLRELLGGQRPSMGVDPRVIQAGIALAGYHIERGARTFAAYAKAMTEDMGDIVKPYLKSWYMGVKYDPRAAGFDGMSSVADVDAANVDDVLASLSPDVTMKEEVTQDGIQEPVSTSDETTSTEDVQPPATDGRDGRTSEPEGQGSQPDVPGNDGQRTETTERPTGTTVPQGSGASRPGNTNRVPGRKPGKRPDAAVKGENFTLSPGALQEQRGRAQKAKDNIRAIELMRQIEAEGRPATREEQEQLALYVGWGGIKGAFPDKDGKFEKGLEAIGERLQALMSPTEYATARRSIQYAHYTAETVVQSMWKAVKRMGFKGGKVFEPGMGVGNFAGLMPADIAAATDYNGLELDHVTAKIAQLLYPKWGVRRDDFTKAPLPKNTYDLVIGNPPFGDIPIKSDQGYPQGFLIHDYFFAKSLDAVRPGGLLAFISSAGTLNKMDAEAREYLADKADFVGAIRLPGTAFEKNAGTSVTTDIIFLRKRLPDEDVNGRGFIPSKGWTETDEVTLPNKNGTPTRGRSNRYFVNNPDMVLGEEGFFDKLYEGRYAVRAPANFDIDAALAGAIDRLPDNIMSEWADTTDRAKIDFGTSERKEGSFYIGRDGSLMQQSDGVGVPVNRRGKGVEGGKTAAEIEKIKALIPVRDALRAVYAADLNNDAANAKTARDRLNKQYDAFVTKFGPINKAEFQYRRPTVVQQESARADAREEARFAGQIWREGDFDATSMPEGSTLAQIARERKNAREAAEKAGKTFDEGSFDPSDLPDEVLDKRPNIAPFMDDPESYRLRAIEHYDDQSGEAKKTEVFFRNVITRERAPEINSINDALLYVLNQRGRLDIAAVAQAAGMTENQAIAELGEGIYRKPGTDNQWVTKDEYLSGDVRRKLRQAKAAAERDPELRRNVDALEAVQPVPLPPSEISANLGMPWIPTNVVDQFGREALGLKSLKSNYQPALAEWSVSGDSESAAARATWGTADRSAPKLIQDALNRQNPKIYREVWIDGKKSRELDVVASEAAQDKLKEIKARFSDWVWSDPARAKMLAERYNDEYNNLVDREYDGSYLTTPGISAAWKWRPHQTRVIARIIQSGNTYMAHSVGSGKTSAMIGAGMEMRRLGLVRKPMYIVPGHMLGQFTKEFYEQYPTARIAVADERRFHTSRRKQFIANVASDDLDAIIITHSAFGLIPISDQFQDELIQQQIAEYRALLEEVGKDQENRITRSRIEKQIERLEQRLSGRGQGRKDQVFTFEEMGADFLFVDEAHLFRKLDFATKMSNVKGISPEGSKASWDLFVKTRYLETVNPGRNLVLASGTPVTNTMAELYTVSRYLQPQELNGRGLDHFDAWAGAFGDTVTNLEQDPSGGYQPVTRFAKFVNVPELSAMVRQSMDVVTSKQLAQYVTRPKLKGGKRVMNLAEKTPELEAYQQTLARRMKAIAERKGPPNPGDDIILSVINDGRHAAIDMRLVDPALPSNPGSKLNLLVDNVFKIWKETKRQPFHTPAQDGYSAKPVDKGTATQMIFANLGISGARGFSVTEYIRSELVRRGVPKDQIANIGDYKTHVAKQRLFNDMNEGKVRVLIGSTGKMATGVNAQRRLYALHNLDPLWYPSDDEQRVGRALRQGNMNPEIEVHDYSTKGTYDSTMWGMMETKARFIQGFFEGDPSLRDMEDLGEASQYEQAKALTTADPRLIELTDLRQQLERAYRRKQAFEREQYTIEQQASTARDRIPYYQKLIDSLEQDIAKRQDTSGDKFKAVVDGKTYTDRIEVGDLLIGRVELLKDQEGEVNGEKVGEIGGFDILAEVWGKPDNRQAMLLLAQSGGNQTQVRGLGSARSIVQSLENAIRRLDGELSEVKGRLENAKSMLREFGDASGKPFTGQAEIDKLIKQVNDLERELAKKQMKELPENFVLPDDFRILRPGESNDGKWHVLSPGDFTVGRGDTEKDALTAFYNNKTFESSIAKANPTDQGKFALRDELAAAKDSVTSALTDRLKKLGISDKVALNLRDRIQAMADGVATEADGRYLRGVIEVSLSAPDQIRTLNHEVVHALRDMGLIRPVEWRTLSAAAKAGAQRMKATSARYEALGLSDESVIEEAIADMYADWVAGNSKPKGFIRVAFERIKGFLQALGNALAGRGFRTMDSIFQSIESGEVGSRMAGSQAMTPAERFDLRASEDPTAEGGAQARQRQAGLWYASQPIDQAFRLPFHLFGGIDKNGQWNWGKHGYTWVNKTIVDAKFSDEGRFSWINPAMEKARAGLIDRYGLDPNYVERERQRGLDEKRMMSQVPEIMQRLSEAGVGTAEAQVLQDILNGVAVADADMMALAEPIRNAIDDMGAEAVQLGLLSAESYERNRGAYLHRVYLKHEASQGSLVRWVSRMGASRRRKIVGDQFKGRGMWMETETGKLMKAVPGFKEALRGKPVHGEKYRVLDLVKGNDQEALAGVEGHKGKRVLNRIYLPASAPVPTNLMGYADRGVWEVRDIKGDKITLWRDFTKPERLKMGEIVDARYTIAKTYMMMSHDLATGRFFQDIAKNQDWSTSIEPHADKWKEANDYNQFWLDPKIEWVKVPDVVIPKSKTKRYGALSGRYVRAEIWRDMAELETMQKAGTWNTILTQWKLNKTARNPVVHMNNVMSNFILMDLADVRMADLARGLRSMVSKDQHYQDALNHGAFGSDMVAVELRRNVLQPLLEQIQRDMQGNQESMEARFGILGKVADAIWSGVKTFDKKMISAYQLEDEVFRMATYVRNLERGMTPNEAAIDARDQFLNYDIRAPWVNAARRSVLPFISYTYRAVPVLTKSIMLRPWKLAKYATLTYAATALSYALLEGDEDEERRAMRETEQGLTWFGLPRMMRSPFADEYGNPLFLDIRRWIPAGDIFDMNQGHGAFAVPAPLQFGGPIMLAGELAFNKTAFTGKPITNNRTDDWWDYTSKLADWGWKSWMPSAAYIPGSWYWEKITNAAVGARDWEGRPYSVPTALASSVGIKLKPHDVQEAFKWKAIEFEKVERELQAEMSSLQRDYDRGLVSPSAYEKKHRRILKKFRIFQEEANATFNPTQ